MLPYDYTSSEFSAYLSGLSMSSSTGRHPYYKKTVEHAEEMGVHVDGRKPVKLLERKRPHEHPEVRKYRLESWEPVTMAHSKRVLSVISRALNDKLYAIDFKENPSGVIAEKEWLPNFLEERYPHHGTLMNFVRSIYIPKMLADPNAVVYVEPLRYDISQGQYFKPISKIAPSEAVLDFEEDEFYIIRLGEKESRFKVIDTDAIRIIRLEGDKIVLEFEHIHNFDFCPAFRLGGIIKGEEPPYYYESFIAGVLPHWNKVITLTSEEDAGIINHLHLERWQYKMDDPNEGIPPFTPDDTGFFNPDIANCGVPKPPSDAKESSSSYKVFEVHHDSLTPEANIPIPPAGYIEKNLNILEHTKIKIEQEEQRGYAAINMDILNKVGENQSGIAKVKDREDLDGFLNQINDHIFDVVIPKLLMAHSFWRYSVILRPEVIIETLPFYSKPQSTNVLSIEYLTEELNTAQNLAPSYKKRLAIEITDKRFSTNDLEKRILKAIIEHDPYYSESTDDLFVEYNNGIVTREKWVQHRNIETIVRTLVAKQKDFLGMDYIQREEKISEFIKQQFASERVMILPGNNQNEETEKVA